MDRGSAQFGLLLDFERLTGFGLVVRSPGDFDSTLGGSFRFATLADGISTSIAVGGCERGKGRG